MFVSELLIWRWRHAWKLALSCRSWLHVTRYNCCVILNKIYAILCQIKLGILSYLLLEGARATLTLSSFLLAAMKKAIKSTGRSSPEVVDSNPTGAKFFLVRGDSQISFKGVTTQGDLVYRQYCLLPAP